jgi:hypothetical protein
MPVTGVASGLNSLKAVFSLHQAAGQADNGWHRNCTLQWRAGWLPGLLAGRLLAHWLVRLGEAAVELHVLQHTR